MRTFLFLFLTPLLALAQIGQEVVTAESNANTPVTTLYFRDGSSNQQYICKALSNQPSFPWAWVAPTGGSAITTVWAWVAPTGGGRISTISVTTNVATITTAAAHGLSNGNTVIITGATTAALNASYTVTSTGANTFTIPTSGVSNGSYTISTDPNLLINKLALAVSTNTATLTFSAAHGLASGNSITLAGATTSGLNGTYVITVSSATVITFTTSGVSDGNITPATDAGLLITTTAPRTTASVWSIYQNFYTSTSIDRKAWANGTTAMTLACGSRTTYAYN